MKHFSFVESFVSFENGKKFIFIFQPSKIGKLFSQFHEKYASNIIQNRVVYHVQLIQLNLTSEKNLKLNTGIRQDTLEGQ